MRGSYLSASTSRKFRAKLLPDPVAPRDQRVAHVAREQVVAVRRAPRCLEHRQRLAVEMATPPVPPRRPEHGREARRESRRYEHLPHRPALRLGREPGEPRGHLAVALPDHLRIVGGEQAPNVTVEPFDPFEVAVQRHGQRRLAVGHAVGFEFDERRSQTVGLGSRRRIDHRGRRALGVLGVRHHRVAPREVVALRAPDPAPRRLDRPRPPFERDRRDGVQAVQVAKEVRVRLAGR